MAGEKQLTSYETSVPDDSDMLLGYDQDIKKVRNFKFSSISDWFIGKLASAVVSELNTTDKTVIGAINELNSNGFNSKFIKTKDFETTLSSYGNANLESFIDLNEVLIIAVSARLKDNGNPSVACTPYQNSILKPNKILGIHCVPATPDIDISNKTILGRIYYI